MLVGLAQVDEAVVGELRHQRLGDLPQRVVELKGLGQPLADPVEQADPVSRRLRADLKRLFRHDHRAGDLARAAAHGRGVHPDEEVRAVRTPDRECAFPVSAPAGLPLKVRDLRQIVLIEPERAERYVSQVTGIGEAEQAGGEVVRVTQAAIVVHDDDGSLDLAEDLLSRKHRLSSDRYGRATFLRGRVAICVHLAIYQAFM